MLYDEIIDSLTLAPNGSLGEVIVSGSHTLTLQNSTVDGDTTITTKDNSTAHINKTTFTNRRALLIKI